MDPRPAADLCAEPRDPRAWEAFRAWEDGSLVIVEGERTPGGLVSQLGVCVRDATTAAGTTTGVLLVMQAPLTIDTGISVDPGPAQVFAGRVSDEVVAVLARMADGRGIEATVNAGVWALVLRPPFAGEFVALDASGAAIHREEIPVPPEAP